MGNPKNMRWAITVSTSSHRPDGRKVIMSRFEEGAGDAVGAMLRALQKRRGGPAPFLGCEIVGVTPLGQVIRRILEVQQGDYVLIPYELIPVEH